jgi:putative cell wall-binding protein
MAYVIGGTSAISDDAYDDIHAHVSSIQRIWGDNRYHTAERVGYYVVDIMNNASPDGFVDQAFFVRGDTYPDALAAAPVAFARKAPIILVRPNELPVESARLISFAPIKTGVVIGGTSAVSAAVKSQIDSGLVANGGFATQRWYDANRFETATEVARFSVMYRWLDLDTVGVAVGTNYPDALGGGTALGAYGSPLLLTGSNSVPSATATFLSQREYMLGGMEIYGGTQAISAAVETQLESYLK